MTRPDRLPESIDLDASLIVRRWQASDVDAMAALIESSLDHLRPWMAWAAREPLDTAARVSLIRRWDRYWASGHGAVYGIFDAQMPVGGCALHRRVGPRGIDLGYWLGNAATGRGVATRLAIALTAAMLERDDIDRVEISHDSSNESSAAVARRAGFELVHRDDRVTSWRATSIAPTA